MLKRLIVLFCGTCMPNIPIRPSHLNICLLRRNLRAALQIRSYPIPFWYAYGWNAVLSVYVDQRFTSRGIGTRLYSALLALLQLQGVVNVYGGVTLPNEKSERLHEKMGFRLLGVYHKTGYKCGSWHDVAWFEKRLCTLPESPAPFLPFSCLPKENVLRVLRTQDQL